MQEFPVPAGVRSPPDIGGVDVWGLHALRPSASVPLCHNGCISRRHVGLKFPRSFGSSAAFVSSVHHAGQHGTALLDDTYSQLQKWGGSFRLQHWGRGADTGIASVAQPWADQCRAARGRMGRSTCDGWCSGQLRHPAGEGCHRLTVDTRRQTRECALCRPGRKVSVVLSLMHLSIQNGRETPQHTSSSGSSSEHLRCFEALLSLRGVPYNGRRCTHGALRSCVTSPHRSIRWAHQTDAKGRLTTYGDSTSRRSQQAACRFTLVRTGRKVSVVLSLMHLSIQNGETS